MTRGVLPIPGWLNPADAIVAAISRLLTGGVQHLAAWAFDRMTQALLSTTQVDLTGWFSAPWRAMLAVAAMLALPILLVGIASEVLAGRPALAVRRAVLLPLAIAPALIAARAVLGLVLGVVNGACALLVQLGVGGPAGFATALNRMRSVLGIGDPTIGAPGASGVPLLFVVLISAFLAFVIWIELAVRAALVYLLAAFIPLAFAGMFWSATSRWTRRLLEVLGAVVLAQLVITALMVLAAAALSAHPDGLARGVDQIAVGLALLFLGSLGLPMTLRLLPHVVEASLAAGAGAAVAHKVRAQSAQLLSAVPHPAARLAGGVIGGRPDLAVAAASTPGVRRHGTAGSGTRPGDAP